MNTPIKTSLIRILCSLLVLVLFTLAIMCIDLKETYVTENGVADEGTEKVEIGLASVNIPMAKLIGYSAVWYRVSDICGYISLAIAASFAIVGIYQWIRRRNIFKVDTEVLALGIFFVIVILIYFFFTKVSINVRPVIVDPEEWPEPSFPSSHTLLAICVVMGSLRVLPGLFGEKKLACRIVSITGLVMMAVAIISRFLSGIHWFTDIIASFIFSALLMSLFPLLEALAAFIVRLFLKEEE